MRLAAAILVWLTVCGTAVAQTGDSGVDAYRQGDYAGAVAAWRPLAEAGDPDAQLKLAMAYRAGLGVAKDDAASLAWTRKSADAGWAAAQAELGTRYLEGDGVGRDYGEARKWFERAADQGHGLAQNNLGFLYANGQGVPQDDMRAYMWFALAFVHTPPGPERDAIAHGGRALAARMTEAQRKQALAMAEEWALVHTRPGGAGR